MAKKKKTIKQDKALKKQLVRINHRLALLNNGIGYLINLILQDKIEEGDASGDISEEHSKKVISKKIKFPSNSYLG